MLNQPRMDGLDNPTAYRVGLALLAVGGVLVLSSFLALGFTGTFLGKSPWARALETTHPRSGVLPALLSMPSVSPGTSSFRPWLCPVIAGGQVPTSHPAAWLPGKVSVTWWCPAL